MARIRGNDLKPETVLAGELRKWGLKVERNVGALPGTPDIVLVHYRFAVFVHGCYWHGCPRHYRSPKTNRRFWREKLAANVARDRRVRRALREKWDYGTCVVWEHDLRKNPEIAADRVYKLALKHRDRRRAKRARFPFRVHVRKTALRASPFARLIRKAERDGTIVAT